jgi:hypothetical protein
LTRASIFLRKKSSREKDGLHRNSGLPELRSIMRRKSGKHYCVTSLHATACAKLERYNTDIAEGV